MIARSDRICRVEIQRMRSSSLDPPPPGFPQPGLPNLDFPTSTQGSMSRSRLPWLSSISISTSIASKVDGPAEP